MGQVVKPSQCYGFEAAYAVVQEDIQKNAKMSK